MYTAIAACAIVLLCAGGCGRFGYDAYALDGDGGPDDADAAGADGGITPPPGPDAEPADAAPPGTPDAAPADATPPGTTGPEVPLVTGSSSAEHPVLAFDGTGFLVVWDDDRVSSSNRELYMTRLPRGATGVLNAPIRITQASGYSGFPSVAWSGLDLGIAWEDGRLGTDEIFFTRIDAAGGAIGTQNRISFGSGAGNAFDPSLAWNGTRYGVAWNSGVLSSANVLFVGVNGSNAAIGNAATVAAASGSSQRSSLAWTGSEYGVAYQDTRDGFSRMYFSRASAQGSALGPDAHVGLGTVAAFSASLATNGTQYMLAYEDNRTGTLTVYLSFLLADGTQVGNDLPIAAGSLPSAVWAGDHFAVLFVAANGTLFLAELGVGVPTLATTRVFAGEGHADVPDLIWTGSTYAAVWQDDRSGNSDVYFREVAP